MSECVLRLDNVTKSFGPVEVIKGVDLTVRRGQVQALLGENGAGKSTLIKMIAGVHEPDSGRIIVDGQEVKIPDTKTSEALGVATIHQELNLVPTMSVAENIMLGRTPRRYGMVNRKHLKAQAQAALHLIGLDVDLDMPVGELGVAKQQLVEIAKALSMNARILILDEPTAALTGKEVDALFSVLEELKAKGVAMVLSATTWRSWRALPRLSAFYEMAPSSPRSRPIPTKTSWCGSWSAARLKINTRARSHPSTAKPCWRSPS